jgi:hypothetical protein
MNQLAVIHDARLKQRNPKNVTSIDDKAYHTKDPLYASSFR